jgi:hypothetical protein
MAETFVLLLLTIAYGVESLAFSDSRILRFSCPKVQIKLDLPNVWAANQTGLPQVDLICPTACNFFSTLGFYPKRVI